MLACLFDVYPCFIFCRGLRLLKFGRNANFMHGLDRLGCCGFYINLLFSSKLDRYLHCRLLLPRERLKLKRTATELRRTAQNKATGIPRYAVYQLVARFRKGHKIPVTRVIEGNVCLLRCLNLKQSLGTLSRKVKQVQRRKPYERMLRLQQGLARLQIGIK